MPRHDPRDRLPDGTPDAAGHLAGHLHGQAVPADGTAVDEAANGVAHNGVGHGRPAPDHDPGGGHDPSGRNGPSNGHVVGFDLARLIASEPGVPPRALLLQGPVGPFFHRLACVLAERGVAVDRVRFNPGDTMFSSPLFLGPVPGPAGYPGERARVYDYREGQDVWRDWLDAHLRSHPTALIVLFGSERPQHRIARAVAAERGVPVVSLEEGYVRPGYVTVERGANNWRSPIAGLLPPERMNAPRERPLEGRPGKSFWWMVRWGFLYFGWRNLAARGRQHELFHKSRPSWGEVPRWARNAWRRRVRRDRVVPRLTGELSGRFDLVPLQVSDDAQLKAAARGWTNRRLIVCAIASFAASAPADRHLVFKVHPLERGHTRDHLIVARLAAMHGVSDRVHCIMSGPLGSITRAARGMITINSTSGLSAVSHRKPLLVLGHAIYRNPALARCGEGPRSIDAFWHDGFVGNERVARHYRSWLLRHALVPGDFYDRAVMDETARNVATRALRIAYRARMGEATTPSEHPAAKADAPSDASGVVPLASRAG